MKPTHIVIDTNVLVAALRSKQGASHLLLRELAKGYYFPAISVPLFVEYESVLKREGLIPALSHAQIDDVLNFILSRASIQPIYFLWRPYLADPKDDMVLELAVAAQSSAIISFNHKDFKGVERFGISVFSPQQFLRLHGVLS